MAATDDEVRILIKAVDEATATIERIEKKLDASNKMMQKSSENTAEAFDKQMGSLIVLGQAAGNVDRIFDSYNNMQLRLENSSERVANAQDRLRKAQYNLTKVQKDTTATAEDLAEAQADVESASRSLNISQNNLAKTQNQVSGTYIAIGVQVVSLVKSMPVLIAEVRSLTAAGMAFIATPIGAALLAISLAAGAVAGAYKEQKEELETLNTALDEYANAEEQLSVIQKKLTDNTEDYNYALNETKNILTSMIKTKTPEESKALLELAIQRGNLAKAKVNGDEEEIQSEQNKLDKLQNLYEADFGVKRDILLASADLQISIAENLNTETAQLYAKNAEAMKLEYNKIPDFIANEWSTLMLTKQKEFHDKELAAEAEQIQKLNDLRLNVEKARTDLGSTKGDLFSSLIMTTGKNVGKDIQVGQELGVGAGIANMLLPKAFTGKQTWWQAFLGIESKDDPTNIAALAFNAMTTKMNTSQTTLATNLNNGLGFMIASPTKGSYPLVYSLLQAETQWNTMAIAATQNITNIISKLNAIPREIVTMHRIVTVYETKGTKPK